MTACSSVLEDHHGKKAGEVTDYDYPVDDAVAHCKLLNELVLREVPQDVLTRDDIVVDEGGVLQDAERCPDQDNNHAFDLQISVVPCVPNPVE